jgi:hypothetical protein
VAELFWRFPSSLGMKLLMAEEVYQLEIAVGILASLFSRLPMMDVHLFPIEEGFVAGQTYSLLSLGEPLFPEGEVFGFRRVPLLPVRL